MLIYIIYIIVFLIIAYVIFVTGKAVNTTLEIKKNNKFSLNENNFKQGEKNTNSKILNEINELKKLHTEGVLNDEEFKKAKKKFLS